MKNRWFDIPFIHDEHVHGEKKPTWLELFFDLIFVASFIQLGNLLSTHLSMRGAATFIAVFVSLWYIWVLFAWLMNRFTLDDVPHRLTTFGIMFCVGAMAISAGQLMEGEAQTFALAGGVGYLLVASINGRFYLQNSESRRFTRYWSLVLVCAAALYLLAAGFSFPVQVTVWVLASMVLLLSPFSAESRRINAMFIGDQGHFTERFGLLTLIVLGESFVKVLTDLAGQSLHDPAVLLKSAVVLMITCSIWWIYFDDVAGSKRRDLPLSELTWTFAHLPMQAGIVAVAVGLKKAAHFDMAVPAPSQYRWLVCGGLATTFFAVSLIDAMTERRHSELSDRLRVNVRSLSGVVVLVLAAAGDSMSAGALLLLIMFVCVAQVAFDLLSSPDELDHREGGGISMREVMERRVANTLGDLERRSEPEAAVRKGMPPEFRRDLYSFFIGGSWRQVFLGLGGAFLLFNVLFGALYAIEPGTVTGVVTFWDGFFFSVQTISTIGYGAMAPLSPLGHTLVTCEAIVGVLFTALSTGLMFAKASRPTANVMFTDRALLTTYNGQPALMLRVANARGHEVVDATVTLTVLMDEVSAEGLHMRRMHDLELIRSRSPFFALSWTIIHLIDESSPLYSEGGGIDSRVASVLCNLIGYDATYAQSIHARWTYPVSDFQAGSGFADIISALPDGRLMIDYDNFHVIEDPEPPSA